MATPEIPSTDEERAAAAAANAEAADDYMAQVEADRVAEDTRLETEREEAETLDEADRVAWEEEAAWAELHGDPEPPPREEIVDAHRAKVRFLATVPKEILTALNHSGIPIEAVMEAKRQADEAGEDLNYKDLIKAKSNPTLMEEYRAKGIILGPEPEAEATAAGVPVDIIEQAAAHGFGAEFVRQAMHSPATAEKLRRLGIDWAGFAPAPPTAPEHGAPLADIEDQIHAAQENYGITITPAYLRFARRNPHAADFLRSLGVDIQVDGHTPVDPQFALMRQGRERDLEVAHIADLIEQVVESGSDTGLGPLAEHLEKPSRMPIVGKRLLALRIARADIIRRRDAAAELQAHLDAIHAAGVATEAQQQQADELQRQLDELSRNSHTDGKLRIGLPRYHMYLDYINSVDASVKSERRKVGRIDRDSLRGAGRQTRRRDLAEKIYRSHHAVEALHDLRIDPDNLYSRHGDYKAANKTFQNSLKRRR